MPFYAMIFNLIEFPAISYLFHRIRNQKVVRKTQLNFTYFIQMFPLRFGDGKGRTSQAVFQFSRSIL